jgi:PBP1b-binding outer membrane lipoprotein LpoB
MKKLICILASAALLGACEQKTEVAPAAPAEKKTEVNTTVGNPNAATDKVTTTEKNTITAAPAPATSTETKTDTTTTTAASPNP